MVRRNCRYSNNYLLEMISGIYDEDGEGLITPKRLAQAVGSPAITTEKTLGGKSKVLPPYNTREARIDLNRLANQGLLEKTPEGFRINPDKLNRARDRYENPFVIVAELAEAQR